MSKDQQGNLFLSERELTLTITYQGEEYSYDFDAKKIMDKHNVMPIDILKGMDNINIRVKDFNQEDQNEISN